MESDDCLEIRDDALVEEMEQEHSFSQEIENSTESLSQLRICETPEPESSSSESLYPMEDSYDGYITISSVSSSPEAVELPPRSLKRRRTTSTSSGNSSDNEHQPRCRRRLRYTPKRRRLIARRNSNKW
ncbi:hypothetical protein QAD02_007818 [Eretmocerus hayati]|uniref:Uncharacterized protein n=1 Tax=Eretmocerus hayati TaxID=131215 RepID=A0ACC2N514_9HYME|nr:hypothetical protein QAD02_007818 [Eretmocerus hayati]